MNNPLNIRYNPYNKWQGQVPTPDGSRPRFCRFQTVAHGYRAAWILLSNYWHIHGKQNLRAIITRFAPPTENHTASYIEHVALYVGISPSEWLPPPQDTPSLWLRILCRMTMIEQGIPEAQVNQRAIRQGFHMAFGMLIPEIPNVAIKNKG